MNTVTTVMPKSLCPGCGDAPDMATSTTEPAAPEPGDFSICLNCGTILRFDTELRVQRATDADFRQAPEVILMLIKRLRQIRNIVVPEGGFPRDERRH